jgi:hypothetical protein
MVITNAKPALPLTKRGRIAAVLRGNLTASLRSSL